MKKIGRKAAAVIMAAMIAGTTCVPMVSYAYSTTKATSDESQVAMKEALTIVKKRVKIPAEVSEFDYSTTENHGTRSFSFEWTTPENAKESRSIDVSITGGIITHYRDSKNSSYGRYGDPELAKLSDKQLLEKAKGYIKQLNPEIADSVKLEIGYLDLFSDNATVFFDRYENGVIVEGNMGSVTMNQDTGALGEFDVSWWDNAEFADPKSAKSEKDVKELYKKLCTLTPYYKIYSDYEYNEKTKESEWKQKVALVYDSDMHSEIDAFTGKKSTIWDDMKAAGGRRFYGDYGNIETDDDVYSEAGAAEEEVDFTQAELEKIEQDNNLVKTDEAFELMKKDKFVALTDDYKLSNYYIYYTTDEKTDEETFYLSLHYEVKDGAKNGFKGYSDVSVELDGETGEVLWLRKYGNNQTMPKLNVTDANNIAKEVTKTYAKDIISGYKASSDNTAPLKSWKIDKKTYYEEAREFTYDRYVNGIQVWGEKISVTVDSNGVVTDYEVNHTEDVVFPNADRLTTDEAFEKLYEQMDFEYYYDGWVTKDGKVKTYLIYRMNSFYLNAKTGKVCNWNGTEKKTYISAGDAKYSDIKGISQENAILTLQKYGVVLTTDSKFRPNDVITEDDFASLLCSVLGGYDVAVEDDVEEEGSQKKDNGKDPKHLETTLREAAKMFGSLYLPYDVAAMKIFKSPFSDVKDSDKDAGYIAVANEKKFITGTNGKLNGDGTITRAEAIQMMYDYLKRIS